MPKVPRIKRPVPGRSARTDRISHAVEGAISSRVGPITGGKIRRIAKELMVTEEEVRVAFKRKGIRPLG